ncbi:unnamed protein product, partial [Meganyctiphanes norvegica]
RLRTESAAARKRKPKPDEAEVTPLRRNKVDDMHRNNEVKTLAWCYTEALKLVMDPSDHNNKPVIEQDQQGSSPPQNKIEKEETPEEAGDRLQGYAENVDFIAKIIFPILFMAQNLVYWPYFLADTILFL